MDVGNETIIEKGIEVVDNVLIGISTKLVIAVIILLLGFVFGKLIGKIVQRFLEDIDIDGRVKRKFGVRVPIEEFFGGLVTYAIYFFTVIMALNEMGLTTYILNIISISIMVIIFVTVILGIRDFVPNIISGIIIHRRSFMKKGNIIRIADIEGEIIEISLMDTRVKTDNGDTISIPNSFITKNKVVRKIRRVAEKKSEEEKKDEQAEKTS